MKKLIIIFMCILFASCESYTIHNRPLYLSLRNGSGWSGSFHYLYCDSFKMITQSEVEAFIDGHKMVVKADIITPQSTENYNP